MKKSVEEVAGIAHHKLGIISRDLEREIFPLSCLPEKRHHQNLANAVQAIKLAMCIIRDIPECDKFRNG